MTNQQHPITPPPELVEQWRTAPEYATDREKLTMVSMTTRRLQEIADGAAQWGADQELEACCAWQDTFNYPNASNLLRADRRPKPPSLAEQAQVDLDRLIALIPAEGALAMAEPIRRALERLQELEGKQ